MSELAATESITAIPALPAVVPAHRAGLLQGILFAILGVVVMYIGLVPMGHVVGIVKVPVVLVSVADLAHPPGCRGHHGRPAAPR
jgi:hypothetical protein